MQAKVYSEITKTQIPTTANTQKQPIFTTTLLLQDLYIYLLYRNILIYPIISTLYKMNTVFLNYTKNNISCDEILIIYIFNIFQYPCICSSVAKANNELRTQ